MVTFRKTSLKFIWRGFPVISLTETPGVKARVLSIWLRTMDASRSGWRVAFLKKNCMKWEEETSHVIYIYIYIHTWPPIVCICITLRMLWILLFLIVFVRKTYWKHVGFAGTAPVVWIIWILPEDPLILTLESTGNNETRIVMYTYFTISSDLVDTDGRLRRFTPHSFPPWTMLSLKIPRRWPTWQTMNLSMNLSTCRCRFLCVLRGSNLSLLGGSSQLVVRITPMKICHEIRPFGRGITTPGLGDLRSPWLLTTCPSVMGWSSATRWQVKRMFHAGKKSYVSSHAGCTREV